MIFHLPITDRNIEKRALSARERNLRADALLCFLIADNVSWQTLGPAEKIPWAGLRRNRAEVAQYFKDLDGALDIQQFLVQDFIPNGNRVIVLGHSIARFKATDQLLDQDWVMVFTLRDGKVVKWQEYEDSAATVSALGVG